MNRRNFMQLNAFYAGALLGPLRYFFKRKNKITIEFIRHATLILEWDGVRLLVDPMLSEQGAMEPVKITRNTSRIPMTPLPKNTNEQLTKIDGILVTHLHRDHWDEVARQQLPKNLPLLCQPTDVETLTKQSFEQLVPIQTETSWKGFRIHRTTGRHGTGEIGKRMGEVSGFVIEKNGKKLYIAGDTIWYEEIANILRAHQPDISVLNAGAAQFDEGDPITMTASDVKKVCDTLPSTHVVAVHMDTVNHCSLTREQLHAFVKAEQLESRCSIPKDGERLVL